VLSGFKPTENHLMFSWPVCSTAETPGRSPSRLLQIILTKAFHVRSGRRNSHCA
jgi:hypothetical protein